MGKRGPKRTPTKILKLRGSARAKRCTGEPDPAGPLVRPKWLKRQARRKWEQLAPQLEQYIGAKQIDSGTLARYCDMWAWWRDLRKWIAENGETYTGVNKKGDDYEGQHPQVNLCLKLQTQLAKLEAEFGLSPAARTGIKIPDKQPVRNEKKRFFKTA